MQLAEWVTAKREELKRLRVDTRNVTPSMRDLTYALGGGSLNVILELSRATPEEGVVAQALDVRALASACDELEIAALAVGTDALACQGSVADLAVASAAASSPLLQRDLVLGKEQLYQARQAGADAILLTAAALRPGELKVLIDLAASMHVATPVEAGTEAELSAAIAAGARVLVIPAFDGPRLSLTLPHALLPKVPRTALSIVRGPFASGAELAPLRKRAHAVWICGPFLRATDPVGFARDMVQAAENP